MRLEQAGERVRADMAREQTTVRRTLAARAAPNACAVVVWL